MINCLNDWVVIDLFILDQYLIDDRYLIADRYLIDLWSIYLFMINWLIFDRLIFDWFSKDWFMFDWLIFVIFDWLIYLVNGPIILLHFVSQLRTSADWEAGIPLPLNKVHGLIWSYSNDYWRNTNIWLFKHFAIYFSLGTVFIAIPLYIACRRVLSWDFLRVLQAPSLIESCLYRGY